MASALQLTPSGGTALFPPELTNEMINLARGKSSLARLSNSVPVSFTGNTLFTFNLDKEVNVVGESGAKSNGGATLGSVTMSPVKVEYGVRISDEFRYAAAERRLPYLRQFAEGFAAKVARGLDIMAFHGFNPRTGSASSIIGTRHFDSQVTQSATIATPASGAQTDGNAAVEAAIALVQGSDQDVTGIAMAPALRSILGAQKYDDGRSMFPDLEWGAAPGNIRGLPVEVNSTVSFGTGSLNRAYVGDFQHYFRWGYARNVEITMIPYGNPDNDADAGDLAGHNQVFLRGEAYIGWAILLPAAFAKIVAAS